MDKGHECRPFRFMNKTLLVLSACLACLSLIFPFREFESLWADFNASGGFLESSDHNDNHIIKGYELAFPYIAIGLLIIGNLFSSFTNSTSAKTVGLILGNVNIIFTAYLYFYLRSPAEALPNSMSLPPVPIVGYGYFILLLIVLATVIYSSLKFNKKQ